MSRSSMSMREWVRRRVRATKQGEHATRRLALNFPSYFSQVAESGPLCGPIELPSGLGFIIGAVRLRQKLSPKNLQKRQFPKSLGKLG